MAEVPDGFPRQKIPKKKTGYLKKMSEKTYGRIIERQGVIASTHRRAKGKCEAEHIAPTIRCSKIRDADEITTRGRGGDPYDIDNTQSLCRKCHTVKHNEPWASTVLGLYGEEAKDKFAPITEDDLERATILFLEAKRRLNI